MRKPNLSATATGSRAMAYSSSNVTRAVPSSITSPRLSDCGPWIRRAVDLHAVGRSEVAHDPRAARRPHLGVAARDVGVVDHRRRPRASARGPRRLTRAARSGRRRAAARCRAGGRARAAARPAGRTPCRPSCGRGRPGWATPRPRCGGRTSRGLDAELARAAAGRRSEVDRRPRRQRDLLAAGVLEQVAGQLALEVVLIVVELLAVVGRQPDGVLVRARRCATATGRGACPSRA